MDNNIKVRTVEVDVKGKTIIFDEYYKVDNNTGEEVFDRDLEIENDLRLYDIYRSQMNLLTSSEIKNIRKKYNMSQKEYALSIGVGEITVHRFENGSIQTDSVDSIMRLSNDPDIMYNLINKNKNNLTKEEYNNFIQIINTSKILKHHKIAVYNIKDFNNIVFNTDTVENVTNKLIIEYNKSIDNICKKYGIKDNIEVAEYITPLKLQKLLYYIQGLSLSIYNKVAFNDDIKAWQYGPVVESVYKKYKGKKPISTPSDNIKLSDGLNKIIELVVSSYGKLEAGSLIDLTHSEEPWKNTKINNTINIGLIKEYFDKVYE